MCDYLPPQLHFAITDKYVCRTVKDVGTKNRKKKFSLHLPIHFDKLTPILQNTERETLYIIINLISHQNLLTVFL